MNKEKQVEMLNPELNNLMEKLNVTPLEPMDAIVKGGSRLYIEQIVGTTKYLGSQKKMIYDLSFERLYFHDLKIPVDHLVLGNNLYRIEDSASINDLDRFIEIFNRVVPQSKGTRFLIDDKEYMNNVPFIKSERLRDELLKSRNDGDILFDCLKIVDPSGNVTEFHASTKVKARMERIRAETNV